MRGKKACRLSVERGIAKTSCTTSLAQATWGRAPIWFVLRIFGKSDDFGEKRSWTEFWSASPLSLSPPPLWKSWTKFKGCSKRKDHMSTKCLIIHPRDHSGTATWWPQGCCHCSSSYAWYPFRGNKINKYINKNSGPSILCLSEATNRR